MSGAHTATVAALAVLVVALGIAGLVLLPTFRSRRRTTTMPRNQTTDPPATIMPDGFDDEDSPFYVHPELRPHYRAEPADRKAVEREAVLVMLAQAAELEVARAVERENATASRYTIERVFTRSQSPAGVGYFLQDQGWRMSQEAREPTDEQVQLAEHTVRLGRAQGDAVRERQAAETRRWQLAQRHCRVCREEDDLNTTDLTLVDGSQVRAHRRCAVAANAALLAGVTEVEWAAAAD